MGSFESSVTRKHRFDHEERETLCSVFPWFPLRLSDFSCEISDRTVMDTNATLWSRYSVCVYVGVCICEMGEGQKYLTLCQVT